MKTTLQLQRHHSKDLIYMFDEDEHRAEFKVAPSFLFKGFVITTKDHELYYVRTNFPHGQIEHEFNVNYHPIVRVFTDPKELVDTAQSIPRSVSICAFYERDDGEQIRSIQLPVMVEANVDDSKQALQLQNKPRNLLPAFPTMDWEKELITDEDRYKGKSYKAVKALMADKGYALDIPVLISILRTYSGCGIDFFIHDLINQTSDIEILSDVYDANIGLVSTRRYLGECIDALKDESKKPEHPLKDFLPLLQDGIYLYTLTIFDIADLLIERISENLKHSMGKYTSLVDYPNAIVGYHYMLLSTSPDVPQSRNFQELSKIFEASLKPEIFYTLDPKVAISKVNSVKKFAAVLLEEIELDMMDKTGFTYSSKLKREDLKAQINAALHVEDALYIERMHYQSEMPNQRKLGIAKMNLRNMQAKVQKFDAALKAGKIKTNDHALKTTALKDKINELDQSISKAENEIMVECKSNLDRIGIALESNNSLLATLNGQLEHVPHNHEYARVVREFFSPINNMPT